MRIAAAPLLAVLCAALAGCADAPTYADVQATASVTGCWPDFYPTPRAATVTPVGGLAAPPPGAVSPGTPAASALPTTTPYPRCPAAAGATLAPWLTPIPPRAPYPTLEPRPWQLGADLQTTLLLPNTVLMIDLAAHLTEGWPAVASVVWSGNTDPERVFVSVLDPRSGTWTSARQVDTGASQIGRYSRTVAVAVTPGGVVHAVWGMSDPDFADGDPPSGIWTSHSADFGATWSAPERIASGCRRVNDLAASPDGSLVAQLVCDAGPRASVVAMVIRTPDGVWQAPERLAVPAWYFSEGAVVVSGEGADARIAAVLFAGDATPTAYLITRPLRGGAWQVRQRQLALPGGAPLGARMWHVSGLAYDRSLADVPTITFTWSDADGGAYAMTSPDSGATWGGIETIAPKPGPGVVAFVAPAYDPAADRLAAIWTCCADDAWESHGTTHYASWVAPGDAQWTIVSAPGSLVSPAPLALGARSAAATVSAQARGSRTMWLAWADRQQRVEVRSLDLNQLIPADQYAPAGGGR